MVLTHRPTPLRNTHCSLLLHYISPSIQSLPQHLIASQLAFRQSCLKLTPDDPAYLFWPSSDDQAIIAALESFQQKPIDDTPQDFQIRYTVDDSFFAHVQLSDLRLVFQWEDGAWKYHNLARMPFPASSSVFIEDLPELEKQSEDGESEDNAPDSYWESYGDPDADREPVHVETEAPDSYWDLYNSVQGSGDSVIPSPVPEKQRDPQLIPYSYADMHPTTDPIAESLSDRLEALSRRTLPSDDDTVTVVNGNESEASEAALKESLRGLWKLWKSTRTSSESSDSGELFLRVVQEVLAEP
ncbi:hypothetical protein R3P38DRAFT_2756957 [Favolaschia claudopus]|uniref:Uncharacterized protein n=1 Tax=Favolaschia claudopus TaxID=2862362 RepID=A0AAW0EI55_9AGAR